VVDTIGAGDAFSAGALHWLQRAGKLDAEAVGALHDAELAAMLGFATAVAALQCTRAGASPPTRDDVQALLRKRDQALPAAHE
jgi:fructokinase